MHQSGRLECNEICTGTDPDNQACSGGVCVREVNALPICLCECRKANVKTKVTHAFGLVDFHAHLNVCQKKEQMHFVSLSTSVSASVCVNGDSWGDSGIQYCGQGRT